MSTREEWLVMQLDSGKLTSQLREKYLAELDAIGEHYGRMISRKKEAEELEIKRRAEIRARILAEDSDFINTLGAEEFGGDYELVQEGDAFIVYSKVCKDDQQDRRVHETLDAAKADLRYLYYNRLYSKYVRPGEVNFLGELVE